MQNSTPLFAGFHLQTLRRSPRSAQQILADQLADARRKSFCQLEECFGRHIPEKPLRPRLSGNHSRRRFYCQKNTFWAFFSQVLDPDGGCSEVVAGLQAYAALRGIAPPSGSTAAYCKARKKLAEDDLRRIFEHTASGMADKGAVDLVCGRRVVVVDGTGFSMPDTPENQKEWPQLSTQTQGCGFPTIYAVACFSLHNSAMLSFASGSKNDSEPELFREQWDVFSEGDIMLGDKMYCNFFDLAMLFDRGVDSVAALPSKNRKPVKARDALKKLGTDDLLIEWKKPAWSKKAAYTRTEWERLPETITLRQIKICIRRNDGKMKSFYLITTLLDATSYSPEQLAKLYFRRWEVELFFRDIKTTMGMDMLRCKSPEMIRKEMLMHFIAYNCMRRLMHDASLAHGTALHALSFKGALQSVRQWTPCMEHTRRSRREQRRMLDELHKSIVGRKTPDRPGRSEPRCVKRRPRSYQRLTAPRHEMVPATTKGRYRAKGA